MARPADFLALTKPGVTRMCVLTTAGAMLLAPASIGPVRAVAVVLGVAAVVAGANAFNMWLERDTDGKMGRTRRRPLPAGRLSAREALIFAGLSSLAGIATLAVAANLLTAALGALALVGYVAVYTPLKYRTPLALAIGAIPGAAPPLLGWTAVTGELTGPGLVLFGILLCWQIPHFLAIALFRGRDYAQAGIRTVPLVRGVPMAKIQAVAWSMVLVPVSLMLAPLGVAGWLYVYGAFALGIGFMAYAFLGLDDAAGDRWARRFFFASLAYLPLLTIFLAADVALSRLGG
ncbi:MAG: protoheme IX farnesyltransferase [Deltaproteobacteria bacterium]|nr:MAG: protoheme IX farnesyltransferase [Deltaproteobacteria bacterium]